MNRISWKRNKIIEVQREKKKEHIAPNLYNCLSIKISSSPSKKLWVAFQAGLSLIFLAGPRSFIIK